MYSEDAEVNLLLSLVSRYVLLFNCNPLQGTDCQQQRLL